MNQNNQEHISMNSAMLGYIELLNQLGYNVLFIDNTFYSISEFIPVETDVQTHKITVVGKNITSKVVNAISLAARSQQIDSEIHRMIDSLSTYSREFSPNTEWKLYRAT